MDGSTTDVGDSEDLVFDGERFIPGSGVGIAYEHWVRYLLAAEYVRGLDVLEVGCGEGYGSAWMARVARSVRAFDADEAAVEHACKRYAGSGVQLEQATVREFFGRAPESAFDAVIAFELIEHLEVADQEILLQGIRRVLRPDGFALISTPDKLLYTDRTLRTNPFHVREYYRDEFKAALERHFEQVAIFDQALFTGSAVVAPRTEEGRTFELRWTDLRRDQAEPTTGLKVSGEYLVALVGRKVLPPPRTAILADFSRKLIAESLAAERAATARYAGELEVARRAWEGVMKENQDLVRRVEAARELQTRLEGQEQLLSESREALEKERRRAQELQSRVGALLADIDHLGKEYLTSRTQAGHEALATRTDRVRFFAQAVLKQPARRFLAPRRVLAAARSKLDAARVARQLEESGLFDPGFYLTSYPDVAGSGKDPALHFVTGGAAERRWPHPLFDTDFYLSTNPDVQREGINPLQHFLLQGAAEGRNPHPLFDTSYYLKMNPDVAGSGMNPLLHFLRHGAEEGRRPNPEFDPLDYLRKWPEARFGGGPLVHFAQHQPATAGALGRALEPRLDPRLDPWARTARRFPRHALVIDASILTPDRDSGSVTTLETMRLLQELGFAVTFVPADLRHDPRYRGALEDAGFLVLDSSELSLVDDLLRQYGTMFEVALVARVSVACHLVERIRRQCPRAALLFETMDLHYLRMEREAALTGSEVTRKEAESTKKLELQIARSSDAVIVHSDAEFALLQKDAPDALSFVVPYVLDVRGKQTGFAERSELMFLGGFRHQPNVDAILYFAREILPLIRRELPDVVLRVVGSDPPAVVRHLETEKIRVTGYVEDLGPSFEAARLMVAPLRYGAGYKGKVAMSLAHGVPAVVTSIAAEGMGLGDGSEVLLGDDAETFARAVVRLYRDQGLWEELSERGLKFARHRFSRQAVRPTLERVLASAGVAPWEDRERPDAFRMHGLPGTAIFPSRFMRELHRRSGITFERNVLVPHGMRFGSNERRRANRSHLVEDGVLKLLFAGRVVRFKGVHTAVASVALLRERLPELQIRLTVVGDRSDEAYVAELDRLVEKLEVGTAVRFEPPKPENALFDLFQQHDVLLFPSLFEPFALTLILALEAGIPTVASTAGGTVDLVRDHATGLLVQPERPEELADAIGELALNPALRVALAKEGAIAARALTLGRMLDGLESALQGNPPPGAEGR